MRPVPGEGTSSDALVCSCQNRVPPFSLRCGCDASAQKLEKIKKKKKKKGKRSFYKAAFSKRGANMI